MKVTIITPTYNSGKTLHNCIESIKQQSFSNIEHYIIDGNSNDNTMEIVKEFNCKYISEPDDGIYDAMNKGLSFASGDIIGILNSDDYFNNENVISQVVEIFERFDCDIVYGNINIINDKGDVLRYWAPGEFLKHSFFSGWHPPHPAVFVKKDVYTNSGVFKINLNFAADFEFMLRVFEKNDYKIQYLDATIVDMGFGGATTGNLRNIIIGNRQCVASFKMNGFVPPFLYTIRRIFPKIIQFVKK